MRFLATRLVGFWGFFFILSLLFAQGSEAGPLMVVVPNVVSSGEIGRRTACAIEWNQLVPPETREKIFISSGNTTGPTDFAKLRAQAASLEFSSLRHHLELLNQRNKNPVVDSYANTLAYFGIGQSQVRPSESGKTVQLPIPGAPTEGLAVSCDIRNSKFLREDVVLEGIRSEMLSRESLSDAASRGWRLSYGAADHWSTLSWIDCAHNPHQEVPQLASNTLRELGLITGVAPVATAGVVFGKIARGWEISFTGRAEAPVFFDETAVRVSPGDVRSERNFILFNVEPGAHMMRLRSHEGLREGVIASPVLAGTATYLDLTEIQHRDVTGQVVSLDSNGDLEDGKVTLIKLAGVEGVGSVADIQGNFKLENVLTVSSYPIYIDSEKPYGIAHRYRVFPGSLNNVVFHRASSAQLGEYIDQLRDPDSPEVVSPDSGMVFGIVPEVIERNSHMILSPSIRPIPSSSSLVPEVYTLSVKGKMLPRGRLNLYESDFIGVQIPEGLILTEVVDETGQVVWSEMTMASPGVVNIVNPVGPL